jgi:hypothetical protein
MHEYDKSSKWLIQHHGDSILRLAGVIDIVSWRPLQAELVQSRRLPDGFIEVQHRDADGPDSYVVEIATYPEARVTEQIVDDTVLVWLNRRVVPEVVVVFLHEKGNLDAVESAHLQSRRGYTDLRASWRVVKLWEVPAEVLLSAGDIGLIPWVPLSRFDGPPEPIVRQCRVRIDQEAPPNEHENLLAVTQFLARLRYNDPTLFQILGGRKAMIESPLIDELKAEWTRETLVKAVIDILAARFGAKAEALENKLKGIEEEARLKELVRDAATCRTISSFRKRLEP